MRIRTRVIHALLGAAILGGATAAADASTFIPNDPALPDIRITEFMYKNDNSPGEFVQVTNLGDTAVSMADFSEDDGSDNPGVHSLAGLGTLQPGESAILAEANQTSFDAAWGIPSSVPYVVENGSDNLGKSDTIYLFDGTSVVDELVYGGSAGGPVTDGVAAVPDSTSVIGTNDIKGWELLTAGADGAVHADDESKGDVASPGYSSFAVNAVPLPPAVWLMALGLGMLAVVGRRRGNAPAAPIAA